MTQDKATAEPGRPLKPWPNEIYAWYVVGVLVVAYTFSFIDRQILSLLVSPMKRDLGISDFEISLLQGFAFAIFYTLMGLPIGRLVDSQNRVRIITAGVAVWSLMTALCGISKSYTHLFLYRMGVGVGEAALSPAAYSILADSFKPARVGTALGIYSIGIYIGAGLALIIGAEVVSLVSQAGTTTLPVVGEVFPWQMVFFVVGVPGLLVALWTSTLREPERRGATQETPRIAEVKAYMRANARTYTGHFMTYGLASMMGYGVIAWIPEFFRRTYGWTPAEAGTAYGWVVMIFGTAGVITSGWLGDKLTRKYRNGRMHVMAATGFLCLPFALAFPLMDNPWIALALIAPATFFSTFTTGASAAAMQEITPNQMRGLVAAIMLFVVNLIGMGLGPSAVAAATDFVFQDEADLRYSLAFVPASILVLSSLFGYWGLKTYSASRDYREQWEKTRD